MFIAVAGHVGWLSYEQFLIVLLLGQPVYDPNPLRPNPNSQKPVLGLCHVRGLGRTLTALGKSRGNVRGIVIL